MKTLAIVAAGVILVIVSVFGWFVWSLYRTGKEIDWDSEYGD